MVKEANPDDPIYVLPRYKVEAVYIAMAETVDWGIDLVGIPSLWAASKGKGIKVAVLDTGIALQHPDLRDAIDDAIDFTGSPSGPGDVQGHGTHVAGTIAARMNSSGVIGAAPESRLLVAKVLGDNGSGSPNQIANGIRWAIDKGADIISMSLGSSASSNVIYQAVKEAYAAGKFIICAAGNEGPHLDTVGYPGAYPEVIAVGAIDRRRNIAQFSSRGKEVDIVAPGDQILSTFPPKGFATLSGTSMATPLVSGVVALVFAKHREFGGSDITNNKQLLEHLTRTAIDLGPNGYDTSFGYGLIDPATLLRNAEAIGSPSSALRLLADDLAASGLAKVQSHMQQYGATEIEIKVVQ